MQTEAPERDLIEEFIAKEIRECETALLASLTITHPNVGGISHSPLAADFDGWSYWDLVSVVTGGSAPAAAVVLGSRVAASAVAALGLAVVAAPITITAGLAGFVWSAFWATDAKRDAYKEAMSTMIDKALLSTDAPETSVLSRHLARLDTILYQTEGPH